MRRDPVRIITPESHVDVEIPMNVDRHLKSSISAHEPLRALSWLNKVDRIGQKDLAHRTDTC